MLFETKNEETRLHYSQYDEMCLRVHDTSAISQRMNSTVRTFLYISYYRHDAVIFANLKPTKCIYGRLNA